MHRKLLGLSAFCLFATFGMLSGVAEVQPYPLPWITVERQEMSDEEKERRREVCNTEFEFCWDWCGKSNPKDENARWKCRDDCKKKIAECMKKIESKPVEEPDF